MSKIFKSKILNINNENLRNNFNNMIKNFNNQIDLIKNSGGKAAIQKQHDKGRLTARERISNLIDENTYFLELGKFAGFEMYKEYGGCPAGGLIT